MSAFARPPRRAKDSAFGFFYSSPVRHPRSPLLCSGFTPWADARDPSSASDEVAVIVREAESLDVTETGTVQADAPPRDAAIDVVEAIPLHIAATYACLRA